MGRRASSLTLGEASSACYYVKDRRPGPSRSSCTLWRALRLFCDDRNGVDAKDLCPSPNQSFLDGFEFVDRVGFNRGGDAVFALYFLVHLPCPPQLNAQSKSGGDGMEGRQGARPVGPPGVLRHSFADELPQARISYVGGRPTERLNSRRPSQACGGRGKARKLRRWSTSSWPNNGRKRWGLVQTGGSTSRGCSGRCSLAPPAV